MHEAAGAQPLGLAGGDELVDDRSARRWRSRRTALPTAPASAGRRSNSHIRSRARRIRDSGLSRTSKRPRVDGASAGCICRRSVWSTQTAWRWLKVPRPLSWPDRRTPWPSASRLPNASASAVAQSKPVAAVEHRRLGVEDARPASCGSSRSSGTRGQRLGRRCRTASSSIAGRDVAAAEHRLVRPAEPGPAALEPVGLVGQIARRRLELLLEMRR